MRPLLRRTLFTLFLLYLIRRLNRYLTRRKTRVLEPTDIPTIDQTCTITTSLGRVRGFTTLSPRNIPLHNFRGIPFAAPPVGPLRFKHSIPPESWEHVLNCTRFGYRSVQNPAFGVEHIILPRSQIIFQAILRILFGWGLNISPRDPHPLHPQQSEDCLTLNVCTPALTGPPLPVAVFIHGGGFILGHASELLYANTWGSPIAEQGVVLVTIQYRLGLLGYCKVEGGDYNCGLSDQVRALEWVRDEIARFGGDPSQVTIFGHSAGAMSVGALLACPRAKGLFARAVLQSGSTSNAVSRKFAHRTATKIARTLGLASPSLAEMSKLPAEVLMAAQESLLMVGLQGPMPFQPVIDDDLLPELPIEAIKHGVADDVGIMLGTTKDEANLFGTLLPLLPFNRWTCIHFIWPFVGPNMVRFEIDHDKAKVLAAQLVDSYAERHWSTSRSTRENYEFIFMQIASDVIFEAPASLLADALDQRGRPVWKYRFNMSGPIGAAHGIELPFLFGTHVLAADEEHEGAHLMQTLVGQPSRAHEEISARMLDIWCSFFKKGNPGRDWPPYTRSGQATIMFELEHTFLWEKKETEHRGLDLLVRKRSESGGAFGIISSPSVLDVAELGRR